MTDDELAMVRAHGFEPVAASYDKYDIDRIRAERNKTLAKIKASTDALRRQRGVKAKGKSAATASIHAQSANYYENNVGRLARRSRPTSKAPATRARAATPTSARPSWPRSYDATGNRIGDRRQRRHLPRPRRQPALLPVPHPTIRLGAQDDGGPMPASVKVASSNGTVDTIAVKEWIAKNPPEYAAGLQAAGFVTHYNDSHEAYKKMRDLATEFPNISQAIKLPEPTTGYQRKAQTMLGYQRTARPTETSYIRSTPTTCPVAGTSPTTAKQARHGRADLQELRPPGRQQPGGPDPRPGARTTRR